MTEAGLVKAIAEVKPKEKKERERKRRAPGPRIPLGGQDAEAMRLCMAILEVLAGMRTPTDAASTLGISPPRYYALESRALGGLLLACQRKSRGPRRTPEREITRLKKELERVGRDCARSQALLRSAQRAAGLSAPKPPKTKGPEGSKKKRRRRPTTRALRAAKVLQSEISRISLEGEAKTAQDAPEVK
jgi:hypothetical protein